MRLLKAAAGRGWSVFLGYWFEKRILFTILGLHRPTDEVLKTTFCLVVYALKACPSTNVIVDVHDLGAQKQNHFLFRKQATGISSIGVTDAFDHRKPQ